MQVHPLIDTLLTESVSAPQNCIILSVKANDACLVLQDRLHQIHICYSLTQHFVLALLDEESEAS